MSSSHRQASIIIGIGLIVVSIVLVIYAFKLPKVNNIELEDYSIRLLHRLLHQLAQPMIIRLL